MRKAIVTSMAVACVFSVQAQQWNGSTNSSNNINRQGDLTVIDGWMQRMTLGAAWGGAPIWGGGYVGFNLRRENTALWSFLNDGASNDGAVIYKTGNSLMFSLKPSTGAANGTLTDAQVAGNVVFQIKGDGKVIVGRSAGSSPTFWNFPGDYNLYVEKGILTEKVKVAIKNTADWSDFVFDKQYKLMPINELQQYISVNKHLPDVPSASEMVSNGLDVARMDASLLQKIEELTLYMIELKKENEALHQRITVLEKQ